MENWTLKINRILAEPLIKESKKKFCRSVARQIEQNPATFPTDPQKRIIAGIFHHYLRVYGSDVEKMVLSDLGGVGR